MEDHSITPRLAGSTGSVYRGSISTSRENEARQLGNCSTKQPSDGTSLTDGDSNNFKIMQWSPDGTTVLTSSADNILRCFILPVNLLDEAATPHELLPYNIHQSPEPSYATAIHPFYDLQNPASTLFLSSLRALPIRLLSPFSPSLIASYPLVSLTTEKFIAPHSLLFAPDNPNHFFTGSESLVSTFDINRNGEGPLTRTPTTMSRRNQYAGGEIGMKGIVSALGISSEGILAAGTFSRWVGLYDGYGRGATMGVFEVRSRKGPDQEHCTGTGTGITQVIWSSCGRYLCTVERESDGIGIWDVRGTGRRLAWLKGRNARTKQRLGVDLVRSEIWAGGIDGKVRIWEGLGMTEGIVDPAWEFHAHDDAVSTTTLHPTGAVLATCSGQRHFSAEAQFEDESDPESESESESDSDLSSSSSVVSPSLSATSSTSGCYPDTASKHPSELGFDNSLKIWAV